MHKFLSSLLLSSLGLSFSCHADSGTINRSIITQRTTFEKTQDFKNWNKSKHQLELSNKHYKEGTKSLKWIISGTEPLILGSKSLPGITAAASKYSGGQPETYEPSFIPASMQGGIKLWVYREKANPTGEITFQVGSDSTQASKNPKYRFSMKQNFTGWRALWVHFEEDAKVADYKGSNKMTAMTIKASDNMQGDEVYFDLMQFLTFISRKRHSDEQFVNDKYKGRKDSYIIHKHWLKLKEISKNAPAMSAEEKASFAIIEKRLEHLILGNKDASENKAVLAKRLQGKLKYAKRVVKNLKLQRQNGFITGKPIFSSRDEQPAKEYETFQILGCSSFYPLAVDYRQAPTAEKQQLLIDLFDHFQDQGFTHGSSLGTTDHIIRLNFYSSAAFLMRKELAALGKLQEKQKTLDWHTRFGKLAGWNRKHGENSDLIRGGGLPKLTSILLMDKGPEKTAHMRAFIDYIVWALKDAPGYIDTIKPDHSIFHHAGAYQNSYGIQALTTLSIINWLTSGTVFELPAKARANFSETLLAQFNFSADFELHPGVCGRFPYTNDGISRMLLPAYAFMAERDGKIIDATMADTFASAYAKTEQKDLFSYLVPGLTFYGSYGTLDLMQEISSKGNNTSSKRLGEDGFFSFPYSGYATQKRQNYMAAVRGFSKYIWDFESGHKGENPFGRYSAFGALMLFTGENDRGLLSLKNSGMNLNGFHWGYMPGATTKELPMDKVFYHVEAHPVYGEGKHRNFSEQTFLGAADVGENGIFGFDLLDTVPADGEEAVFEKGFSAKKSYFFFDDQIVCLGSGIQSSDQRYNTITTLFQNLHDVVHPTAASINGKAITPSMQSAKGGILGDAQGNYYIVPERYNVEVRHGEQKSLAVLPSDKSKKGYQKRAIGEVKIPASKAWITHGKAPQNHDYEYSILPKSSLEQALALKNQSTYQVLRKDNQAHIVKHSASASIAYVLFDLQDNLPGPIAAVNTPLIINAKENKKLLELSIADPNLRLAKWNHNMSYMPVDVTNAPAQNHFATIIVKGHWQLAKTHKDLSSIKLIGDTTSITLKLNHGLTRQLRLNAIQ